MIEPAQILLIIVVSTLTVLLTIIGIQVFFILQEFRRTIQKMNKILDDASLISESVAKPISKISGSLVGLSGVTGVLSLLASLKNKKNKKQEGVLDE